MTDKIRGTPKLTGKQEKFVQELIKGKSQRQAFIAAGYSSKNKTDEYLDVRACELMKNRKVLDRYNELMGELKKKALWTRERAIEELLEMLDDSKLDKQYAGRYNAIKELSTLCDLYPKEDKKENEPTKIVFNIESVKRKEEE